MLKSIKAKIIAGVCAAAVVGGGVTAGVLVLKNSGKRPAVSVTSTPTVSKPATVSEPAVSSAPTVSTSEVVSKPEEPSEPEASKVDYYGKAVEGDFEYQYMSHGNKIDQSAAMITKYTGSEEKVTIPSTIGGKPVKSLKDTFEYNKTITEVTIPDSVIYLENGVFNGCRSLTKVNFLGAPKQIRDGVFADCKALEYIELPDGVERIGYSAFDGSKNLKTVIFPDSVRVETGAFRRCSEHIEVHYKGKIYTKETVDELYELCPYVFDPND